MLKKIKSACRGNRHRQYSSKWLKRIVNPKSQSNFTEEEAVALMLEIRIPRNKYQIFRKALFQKGHAIFPSYNSIQEKWKAIMPSPLTVDEIKAFIKLSSLLENMASRIPSDFSTDQL